MVMKSKKILALLIIVVALLLFLEPAYLNFDREHQLRSAFCFLGLVVAINASIILANSGSEANSH